MPPRRFAATCTFLGRNTDWSTSRHDRKGLAQSQSAGAMRRPKNNIGAKNPYRIAALNMRQAATSSQADLAADFWSQRRPPTDA
jgi:hypothetical protein